MIPKLYWIYKDFEKSWFFSYAPDNLSPADISIMATEKMFSTWNVIPVGLKVDLDTFE